MHQKYNKNIHEKCRNTHTHTTISVSKLHICTQGITPAAICIAHTSANSNAKRISTILDGNRRAEMSRWQPNIEKNIEIERWATLAPHRPQARQRAPIQLHKENKENLGVCINMSLAVSDKVERFILNF